MGKVKTLISESSKERVDAYDDVSSYLKRIGKIPLLSKEEEISYGEKVQRMMKILEKKKGLDELNISNEELNQILTEGQNAKKRMVEANLRLVVSVAKKYQRGNLKLLDLIQEGSIGLTRGVEKFDPALGYKLSTYIYWWIRQAITRAIHQQGNVIHLPTHITEQLNKIKRVQREFIQKHGRKGTVTEIGKLVNLKPERVRDILNSSIKPISLSTKLGENQDTELQDLIEANEPSPDEIMLGVSLKDELGKLISQLPPKHQDVINSQFGLHDGIPYNSTIIAKRLGISRKRVDDIRQRALVELKKQRGNIQDYMDLLM